MSDPVIDIEGVWFAYNGRPVLRDVTLEVAAREMVCMVGPNGGGKTTLLKLLLGLLRPGRGRIRVLGLPPREARARAGYVPQHMTFDPRFPVSVLDVVRMGRLGVPRGLGRRRREDRRAAEEALEEVDMLANRRRTFGELSGGQQQRVMIARALASRPEMLLLDEPTANLDLGVELEFRELLGRLNERMTIVLVSHDIGFVTENISKVVCVQGEVKVHPTAELTGELMRDLYGQDIRLVRHDHVCARNAPPQGQEPADEAAGKGAGR